MSPLPLFVGKKTETQKGGPVAQLVPEPRQFWTLGSPRREVLCKFSVVYKWKLKMPKITDVRHSTNRVFCVERNARKTWIRQIAQTHRGVEHFSLSLPLVPGISVVQKVLIWKEAGKESQKGQFTKKGHREVKVKRCLETHAIPHPLVKGKCHLWIFCIYEYLNYGINIQK